MSADRYPLGTILVASCNRSSVSFTNSTRAPVTKGDLAVRVKGRGTAPVTLLHPGTRKSQWSCGYMWEKYEGPLENVPESLRLAAVQHMLESVR